MKRLRALLVDDEPLALRRLSLSLAKIDAVEVVGSTTSARKAVELVAGLRPDVVFLDVAMPGLSGFDVVQRLSRDRAPAIIFVTAYDHHAVRAFDADAADYLLKPFAPERLREAVGRARNWLEGRAGAGAADSAGSESDEDGRLSEEHSLWVHRHREIVRVQIEGLQWIEAEGDYVRLHADNGGGLLRMTLTALEARLDPDLFVRVHRSAICRKSAITGLRRNPTGTLTAALANGDRAPVGRTYSRGLKALLKRIQDEPARPA